MQLTSENVEQVFRSCLFKEGENTTGYVEAHAVRLRVGFHPVRIEENREAIKEMLSQLPYEFHQEEEGVEGKAGGGWSFLNMCQDIKGTQWTDFHDRMDQLLSLGLALKLVEYLMPDRNLWGIFPGGMPYITVLK